MEWRKRRLKSLANDRKLFDIDVSHRLPVPKRE